MSEQLRKLRSVLDIELPEPVAKRIVVTFADSNPENWEPSNLSYHFANGPAECPFYEGFFYVPGFSRYAINKEGALIVIKTGYTVKWTITRKHESRTNGYRVSQGKCDHGHRKLISRHRALCLVFKHPEKDVSQLVVNHKNGIPGNDWLDNLEWCTEGENILHAYRTGLYPDKVVAVDAWNWITGEQTSFISVTACAEALGIGWNLVKTRMIRGNNRRHEDGWRFKFSTEAWLLLDEEIEERDDEVEVVVRNVFTNDVVVYGSMNDAARATGILQSSISAHIANSRMLPLRGYNFRKLDEFEGWPTYTERHLEIFRDRLDSPGDGIEVYDRETNTVQFFTSPEKAGEHFGISPVTANKLARYESTRADRFTFKLFRVRENIQGPTGA